MHTVATENQGGSLHNQYKHSDESDKRSYRNQMETQDQMPSGQPVDKCAVMQPRLL
jgi:hypothetical protein